MTAVRAAQQDERDFSTALDRWSPGLLALALAFAQDAGTAHRMVEHGWVGALRSGDLEDPTADVRTLVVRAMAGPGHGPGDSAGAGADAAVLAGQRALRHALLAAGVLVLPRQRAGGPPVAAARLPVALDLSDLRRLPPPLRLVLLLTDVQRWPAAEVEALLGVRPAARRSILGHARRTLLAALEPRSASA